jgi:hypothetical protein
MLLVVNEFLYGGCSSSDNLRLIRGIGREALAHQG